MQHDLDHGPVAPKDYGDVLGTPFKVYLSDGVHEWVDTSGKVVSEITDVPGLIGAIVQSRVLHRRKLSGHDLKYIRSALCLQSNEVATVLGLTPEHYCRCETGIKALSEEKEKIYRMYAFLCSFLKDRGAMKKVSKGDLEKSINDASPEKAKEAIVAFAKIFFGIEINHIYSADSDLEFYFSRGPLPCNSGTDWRGDELKVA